MKIAKNILDLVGRTPLLELSAYAREVSLSTAPIVKLEYFNPAGSVKDRTALSMVCDAERQGMLEPGSTIIEPTSGNTGVGLAMVAAVKGYRLVLTMPENMSTERMNLLRSYGAELVLTAQSEGMDGAIAEAERLQQRTPGSIILHQFDNPSNPAAHLSTANEIWEDTEGQVDVFVGGVGTGGTITGVARELKQRRQDVYIVAVEPAASPVLSGGKKGPHRLQGIGAGFVPSIYDGRWVDEVMPVTNEDAVATVRTLVKTEGLLVGFSSGAALSAATCLLRRPEMVGKRVVVLLPDHGERYLSTDLFRDR